VSARSKVTIQRHKGRNDQESRIDVVNVLSLIMSPPGEQALQIYGFAEALPVKFENSGIGAAERAAGEKKRFRTRDACERRFFAEVRAHISHLS